MGMSGPVSQQHRDLVDNAYADERAGEVGTVYQAAGWLYIGRGVGRGKDGSQGNGYRFEFWRNGEHKSSKQIRTMYGGVGSFAKAAADGWVKHRDEDKHKYVWFEGPRRRQLRLAMKYPVLPYVRRHLYHAAP